MAVEPVSIAAGTIVTARDVTPGTTPGTAVEITEVQTIGAISQRSAEINATPLSARAVRYIPGLKDGQTQEIAMFWQPTDPGQMLLKTVYDKRGTVEVTVKPPDMSQQIRYNLTLLGHDIATGTTDGAKMRTVNGRISSDPIFEANTNPEYDA
ncbi:hypothetical protein [Methylorubrum zatmanii]